MKRFITKKYILIAVGVLVLGGIAYGVLKPKADSSVQTETVKLQNLKQTVLATGQVSSSTDLNLSFKGAGIVGDVKVKVGDQVTTGDILANLDQKDQLASLTQARGSYASAQANYNKVIAGASSPEVEIARTGVVAAETSLANAKTVYDSAKRQQDILVKNALTAMLTNDLQARRPTLDSSLATATISGAYNSTEQGSYRFEIYVTTGGLHLKVSGLENVTGIKINRGVAQPLGTRGLFITFSTTGSLPADTVWTVDVPNTQSATYVTYYNAYQAAVQNRDQTL